MKGAGLQRFARRSWAGKSGLVVRLLMVILTPVSWIWRLVTHLRNRRWDRHGGTTVEGLRVVSVGNLAVGGTGKTPLTSWIVRELATRGATPAVLLRGYGRDEAMLHRQWNPTATVVVDPDRVAGARRARELGSDVAVLDDGFQHRRMARARDLVLLAVEDRFPGRLLPTGPYRESAGALTRADAVILTRRSASVADARAMEAVVRRTLPTSWSGIVACVHLATGAIRPLSGEGAIDRFDAPLVVTAIARPDDFLGEVARLSRGEAGLRAYVDHHDFSEDDAVAVRAQAGARPIVVTEKDAVKLVSHAALLGETWVVEQRLVWDWGEEEVVSLLEALTRSGAS